MGQKIGLFNSLTKTKNRSGRNEVIETSGRLHPLWPQDKWLHTPRTTDYWLTRQDRWIQTELVSTLAKKCHKTESLWNHTTIDHKEGEQLEDRRNVGESSCNFGEGTDQRVQSLMFMMMNDFFFSRFFNGTAIHISRNTSLGNAALEIFTDHSAKPGNVSF